MKLIQAPPKADEMLDLDDPKHHGDDIEVDDDTVPPVDKIAREGLS